MKEKELKEFDKWLEELKEEEVGRSSDNDKDKWIWTWVFNMGS